MQPSSPTLAELAAEFSRKLPMDPRILSVTPQKDSIRVCITDYSFSKRLSHSHRGTPVRYAVYKAEDAEGEEIGEREEGDSETQNLGSVVH
jgi:hypothetical protein